MDSVILIEIILYWEENMKILINILNVLGAIISSFLMPVLLIALIACPVANAVSSLTHPDTITDMIDKIVEK